MIVWALSDGIPGHDGRARALVRALEHLGPVSVEWLRVPIRFGGARSLLGPLLNLTRGPLPDSVFRAFYRMPALPAAAPDAIVSSGGKTTFLSAALARRFGCRNFFAGTLRGLSERHFTAFTTPFPIAGAQRNVVTDVPLTDVDAQEVAHAGAEYRKEQKLGDERVWAALIGGDGSGYRYSSRDWADLAAVLEQVAAARGIRWLLVTSRRTGADGERVLRDAVRPELLADAAWYEQDKRKVVKPFLGAAEAVFCTEDSMSMLGEAVSARRPVYSLRPATGAPKGRDRDIVEGLARSGRIARLSIAALAKADDVLPAPESLTLLTDDPLLLLGEALRLYLEA